MLYEFLVAQHGQDSERTVPELALDHVFDSQGQVMRLYAQAFVCVCVSFRLCLCACMRVCVRARARECACACSACACVRVLQGMMWFAFSFHGGAGAST